MRLNYGVFFRPKQVINVVTHQWTHVYELMMPTVPNVPSAGEPQCSGPQSLQGLIAQCRKLRQLFIASQQINAVVTQRLGDLVAYIPLIGEGGRFQSDDNLNQVTVDQSMCQSTTTLCNVSTLDIPRLYPTLSEIQMTTMKASG